MTETAPKLILIPLILFVVFFSRDIFNYTKWTLKAQDLSSYSVEQMSVSGGWNEEVAQKVEAKAVRLGIDFEKWQIRHTEGTVSAPGIVTFGLDTRYHVTAFSVFGKRMEEIMRDVSYLPIVSQKETVSQIYAR